MAGNPICLILNIWLIAVFARILLSWFPVSPGGPIASIYGVLYTITEPVLGPIRRVMPTIGMFDISPIVVIFGVQLIEGAIGCRGGFL